jgi:two-component system LytT family response regulator
MRILVVDDEASARARLRGFLDAEKDSEVVAECSGGEQAVEAIRSFEPDLVFLDIQLPDMDGMEVVRRVGARKFPVVVFVTGYDRYAVAAFDIRACDYLLKPFTEDRFRETLARARAAVRRRSPGRMDEALDQLSQGSQPGNGNGNGNGHGNGHGNGYLKRLVVRLEDDRVKFFDLDEIDWIEADAKFVLLHSGGAVTPLKESIGRLEERLDPTRFLRVHRSAIVNLDRVAEVDGPETGSQWILLKNGERLPLSRANRPKLYEVASESSSAPFRKPDADSIS